VELTYEAVQKHPEVLQRLLRQARRQRAETVHQLLVAALARLFAPLESGDVQGRPAQG
jgi:hypothetical protein